MLLDCKLTGGTTLFPGGTRWSKFSFRERRVIVQSTGLPIWVPYLASAIVTHTTPFVYIFDPSLPFLPFLLFFFFSSIHHILSGVLITPLSQCLDPSLSDSCDSQCFTSFDFTIYDKNKNLHLFNPPIDRMGQRHNRRRSRLRPNRNRDTDPINSPIDSDPFSRSLAPTWHYGSVNWTRDRPLRLETEQRRLFGGEPGDDAGLCYHMLEYFGGLDYLHS